MLAQEARQRLRQMLRQARGGGKQQHAHGDAAGEAREIAAHRIHIVHHQPCVIEQAFAGGGELDAAATALEQGDAKRLLQPPDPGADGSEREMAAVGAARDAAVVGHRDEKLQVDQVEAHGNNP